MNVEEIKLSLVKLNEHNPREISPTKFEQLIDSILAFPKMLRLRPSVVDNQFIVLGGNMRTRALREIAKMSFADVTARLEGIATYKEQPQADRVVTLEHWRKWLERPTAYVAQADGLTEQEKQQFIIKDNAAFGKWDFSALANEWDEHLLQEWGVDVWAENGYGQNGENEQGSGDVASKSGEEQKHGKLTDRFIVPPFTILDTRQGYWKERKAMWHDMIGDNGESRENTLADGETNVMATINNGVSILDPVMAELVCRWFGIEGGTAFDCFAGDTVFGYVAAKLGLCFTGIELRKEQCDLNNERVQGMSANYICDDGQNVLAHLEPQTQDLFFSCPPYYDLEVYSDNPKDASNQPTYNDFIAIIENSFASSIKCLKDNRFACVVVGDVRAKDGFYYGFVDDIKRIFAKHGMRLYNEMIIVEPIGTLPQRVARYMRNRKIGKCHQNVLVFYKGDTKEIANQFKEIKYASEDLEQFNVDNGNATATA